MANRPDYVIAVMDPRTNERNSNIGAAWINSDGSIYLKVDLGCMIYHNRELSYKLFPQEPRNQYE